jgi:hypothetical protein
MRTLREIEEIWNGLDFEEHLLEMRLTSELIEVLVLKCLGRRYSFDWRILHNPCDQIQ